MEGASTFRCSFRVQNREKMRRRRRRFFNLETFEHPCMQIPNVLNRESAQNGACPWSFSQLGQVDTWCATGKLLISGLGKFGENLGILGKIRIRCGAAGNGAEYAWKCVEVVQSRLEDTFYSVLGALYQFSSIFSQNPQIFPKVPKFSPIPF